MALQLNDTIAAIGTATGNAYRGVVRISGPTAVEAISALADQEAKAQIAAVQKSAVVSTDLILAADLRLPCEIYIWPDQRSYTREPIVEIHTIGNRSLLNELLNHVLQQKVRLAEPGEFTMRAFLAGRLDLAQAEAVLGIIDAEGDQQLSTALTQLAGGLSTPLHDARTQLLESLALLEAGLDFSEEDIEFVSQDQILSQLKQVTAEVEKLLIQMQERESSDTLPKVALLGLPNAGKSSLFNAMLDQQQAIVSPVSGTTRDYLSAVVQHQSLRFQLIDTAGVEEASEQQSIDGSAQVMTHEQLHEADLILHCVDAHAHKAIDLSCPAEINKTITVFTKCDLVKDFVPESRAIKTSVNGGYGIDQLKSEITHHLEEAKLAGGSIVAGTAVRCQTSLRDTLEALNEAKLAIEHQLGEEIVAGEIRLALSELGKVVGVVYTDDVLDVIFSRFCIGK